MDTLRRIMLGVGILFLATPVFATGSIQGTVVYKGNVPHAKLIHMDADAVCYAIHKGNVRADVLSLGNHNTLGNVFIYIKDGLVPAVYPSPQESVTIDQSGCNYNPHVVGVRVGQKVGFLNPDGTLHNVHAFCHVNPEFNASMPDFRKEMSVVFNKPEGMFPIRCDVHPWMQAWMAVMAHPFFAVTAVDGTFNIKDIPAGMYTIEAWHEKLHSQTATLTVKDGSVQKLDFIFSNP